MTWIELDPESPEVLADNADVIGWLKSLRIRPRVFRDEHGVLRFQKNRVVGCMANQHPGFMNWAYRTADKAELYTLIGCSLDVFGEAFSGEIEEFSQRQEATKKKVDLDHLKQLVVDHFPADAASVDLSDNNQITCLIENLLDRLWRWEN